MARNHELTTVLLCLNLLDQQEHGCLASPKILCYPNLAL